jgi:hypothetical protein
MADNEYMSGSIEEAAAFIDRLGTPEASPEPQAAPAAPEPEQEEISPQEPATPAAQVEGSVSEAAKAPAIEAVPNPVTPATPPAQAASSPELEQKLSEADKATREASAARDNLLGQLNAIVPQLQASVRGEFSDIKSEDDVLALMDPGSATYNPDRYNKFVMATRRLQGAQAHQQRLQAENVQATLRAETAKVAKILPEFVDPVKGPALIESLKAFAKSKDIDVTNRPFLASDVVVLNSLRNAEQKIAVLEKEKADRAAQVVKAEEKAAKAPPVQQPGAARTDNGNDKAKDLWGRAQKSGRIDDLAAYFDAKRVSH